MENHHKTQFDIIFVLGEKYYDHPLCGIAILRRLLEKEKYSVAVIEMPQNADEIMKFGIMMTPALAVDGQVKIVGKVPSPEEIKNIIK